jgi:hypothetical protein
LLLAFQQNWFHLIRSFLAKVIWFLGCSFRSIAGSVWWATGPSGPEAGAAGHTAELAGRLLPTAIFFPTYKYPSSSLNQQRFWASLSSIIDLQSLPSLLLSLHVSCIFLREKREEI